MSKECYQQMDTIQALPGAHASSTTSDRNTYKYRMFGGKIENLSRGSARADHPAGVSPNPPKS